MEDDWKDNLALDSKGNALKTISNLRMIFTHDENLRQIRFDTFCQDDISFSPLFRNVNCNKVDEESVGKIQDYLEQNYDLRLTQNKVFEMLKTTASERNFNPVQDYIRSEKWDGTPRIETAIIDYLGAEDTLLIREQTKLWFVAAVARAFEPGCKFDDVLTLPGPQGIGKSTFFKVIGDKWFNDSFSFASGDKEKVETITNGWIVEISELNGMKRANDAEAAKVFLSRRSDCMRPAYGRKPIEYLRHNVFAATTNETNFLQGDNGNRRWWIVPVQGKGHVSDWLSILQSVVHQLWAEAYTYYKRGTNLYLCPESEEEAYEVQMCHSSISLMTSDFIWNVLCLSLTTHGAFPCVLPIRKAHMPKRRSTASPRFCSTWSVQDRLLKNCPMILCAGILPSTPPSTSTVSCRWWMVGNAASRRRSKGCTLHTVIRQDGRNTHG